MRWLRLPTRFPRHFRVLLHPLREAAVVPIAPLVLKCCWHRVAGLLENVGKALGLAPEEPEAQPEPAPRTLPPQTFSRRL